MVGAAILASSDLGSTSLLGPLGVVVAALAYAVFSVSSKPLVHKYGAAPVTIWAGLIGTLMLLPMLPFSNFAAQVASLSLTAWLSVLYLSLLSTVVGYTIFYTLVSRGAVSKLFRTALPVPVVSVIGGVILLKEGLSIYIVVGGALLLSAMAVATRSKS